MGSFIVVTTLAAALVAGCGATSLPSSPSPITSASRSTGSSPAATLVVVTISPSGPVTISTGDKEKFAAMAKFSDSSEQDVTSLSVWSSSAPPFADVENGMVLAKKAGNLQINARFGGMTGVLPVTVVGGDSNPPTPVGVPWSSLPFLTEAEKSYAISGNLNLVFQGTDLGVTHRFDKFPIAVYSDVFRPDLLTRALGQWESATAGKGNITTRVVGSSAEAMVNMDYVWPPPESPQQAQSACAVSNPGGFVNNVATFGFAHFAFGARPECRGSDDYMVTIIAHEFGHILGLGAHTTDPNDIMYGGGLPKFRVSPLTADVINWLYTVPPGTRPQ